jgi:hypothetical protein
VTGLALSFNRFAQLTASLARKVWPPGALLVIATALVLGAVLGGGLALARDVAQDLSATGLTTALSKTPTQDRFTCLVR